MIVYVIPENPDNRILERASQVLKDGRLFCLPTESNWMVLADPFSKNGIERLCKLRQVDEHHHFTLFCADVSQATTVAQITDQSFRYIKKLIPGPYTFIFKAQKITTKYLKASKSDHQVGVRFPPSELFRRFLEVHGGPAMGTHITADMIADHPEDMPLWSMAIDEEFGNDIDLVMDIGEVEFVGPTTIIDLSEEGPPVIVREGAGPL